MKLIIGLGNPGRIYINSRHNIGFRVIRALAGAHKITFKKDKKAFALSGKGKLAGCDIILAMPLTFMNLSGISVKSLLEKYKIDLSDLLVVCDDLDLEFGRLKIKASGSSGGHRGLRSIIDNLQSRKFGRLRIGIGRPKKGSDAAKYVLGAFLKNENRQLSLVIEEACLCCQAWSGEGIVESMNRFNKCGKKSD